MGFIFIAPKRKYNGNIYKEIIDIDIFFYFYTKQKL